MGIEKSKLIKIQDVGEQIKLIEGSDNYYISINGNIYHRVDNNYLFPKAIQLHPTGYQYCEIYYNGKGITKRVHKLVATAFIPNPNNYPIVGHINDLKFYNRAHNLTWCSASDNTQKAVDAGLLKNDASYNDSQSVPVIMYDTKTGEELERFGSMREASRKMGIYNTTISRQCKNPSAPIRKDVYFRYNTNVSLTTIENYNNSVASRVGQLRNPIVRSARPLISPIIKFDKGEDIV